MTQPLIQPEEYKQYHDTYSRLCVKVFGLGYGRIDKEVRDAIIDPRFRAAIDTLIQRRKSRAEKAGGTKLIRYLDYCVAKHRSSMTGLPMEYLTREGKHIYDGVVSILAGKTPHYKGASAAGFYLKWALKDIRVRAKGRKATEADHAAARETFLQDILVARDWVLDQGYEASVETVVSDPKRSNGDKEYRKLVIRG